jgi:DNA end-binding protein Ku
MSRAIWKGHISFGLVEIPVSLVKAEEGHELDLHLVDRRDHAPIGYQRINKNTGEPVEWDDIVKAHDENGELVLLSDAELANADSDLVKRIEILEFVDGADIHPAFYERPYYLEPAKKPVPKAYVLLREVLERTGKVGIATIVLRTRQHLAAVTTRGEALVVILLRFGDELRDTKGLDLPGDKKALEVRPKEIEMAEQLVASMDAEWDPDRYHDRWFDAVTKLIAKKRKAGETEPLEVAEAPGRESTSVVDLMPLLAESMKAKKGPATRKKTATKRAANSRPRAKPRKSA